MAAAGNKYHRVLLKLSGEALVGKRGFGIDPDFLNDVAQQVARAIREGVQVAIVVGGGNIFRGISAAARGVDRSTGDHMGMLATVINSLALQAAIERQDVPTRVQTAITMSRVAEPYIRRRAIRHLEKGRVVVFGAGTGNPFFSTDTAAVLRASEINADVVLKATKVDGVYDSDPMKNSQAVKYSTITPREYLERDLRALDATAVALGGQTRIPICVFNATMPEAIYRGLTGNPGGTLIVADEGSTP